MQICTFTQKPFNDNWGSLHGGAMLAWWWNHTKPGHILPDNRGNWSRWSGCENARELTDTEYAELIPILDDFLLALEYARNPPYGD